MLTVPEIAITCGGGAVSPDEFNVREPIQPDTIAGKASTRAVLFHFLNQYFIVPILFGCRVAFVKKSTENAIFGTGERSRHVVQALHRQARAAADCPAALCHRP
jgi:hypothetical protein